MYNLQIDESKIPKKAELLVLQHSTGIIEPYNDLKHNNDKFVIIGKTFKKDLIFSKFETGNKVWGGLVFTTSSSKQEFKMTFVEGNRLIHNEYSDLKKPINLLWYLKLYYSMPRLYYITV